MSDQDSIDIFDYLDYRAYLRDFYTHEKERKRGFSFRAFSRRAKLSSPNYLKRVMEGDRNLTLEMAARFATACKLEGEGAEYFVRLVAFNQAKDTEERSRAYAQLTGFRQYRSAHRLDLAHAAYHATWYIPAIRELAGREDFEADPEWIASRLLPRISVSEARRALETLKELGLLIPDEEGRLVQAEALVTTGPEMQALHIANYHFAMMERAGASIDLVAPRDRDISSVTLLLGEDGIKRIKKRIQSFRRELLELALIEEDGSQVVQVNFQLFPLSRSRGQEPTR